MRIIFLIILVLVAYALRSQTVTVQEKHFIKEKKILFRLCPANMKVFDELKLSALKITRYQKNSGVLTNETVIEDKLRLYWIADTLNWKRLYKKDKAKAAFAYQVLFSGKSTEKIAEAEKLKRHKMLFDFLMLSCNFDSEIARACGLFFVDSTAIPNTNYTYKIAIYTTSLQTKAVCNINLNSGVLSSNKEITSLEGKNKKGICNLKWKAADYSDDYSGYNVERSSDSVNYKIINTAPLILIRNQFEKNREHIFYADTLPEAEKKYFYRLRGINFFGEAGPPSNNITVYNFKKFNSGPVIKSINVTENKKVTVNWSLENDAENNLPKNFVLFRSDKDKGIYKQIFSSKSTFTYTDSLAGQSSYYKVAAVDYDNDTTFSFSRLAIIIDTIAPAFPKNLKATCDKTGKVYISWTPSPEKDLKGYKLFKSNQRNGEFVQMNNKFITDTFYTDKLNLKTLSKSIFYSVVATDNNFNTSVRSEIIEVKKADTIAPTDPILNYAISTQQGVLIKFVVSESDDVLKHILCRRTNTLEKFIELKTINKKDTITSYLDSTVELGKTYLYSLKSYDSDENTSSSDERKVFYETGYRKKLVNINYKVDRALKTVNLSWSYDQDGVEKFILYRGKEKEPLTIIKTVTGKENSFTDKTLNIGNVYEYRIKAVLYNGAESILSDAVKVVY